MPRFVSESHATITQARIGKLVQASVEKSYYLLLLTITHRYGSGPVSVPQ